MPKFYKSLTLRTQKFISEQKIFFVATAPLDGRINLSPKGMDSFRVINENRVLWLNFTGSGNETAAHILENKRITIMFCSFKGAPNILRIYGKGKVVYPNDPEWENLISLFPDTIGARQIFDITVESAQDSCGMSIPYYEYLNQRNQLKDWVENQGQEGVEAYWKDRNTESIDGLPTGIK